MSKAFENVWSKDGIAMKIASCLSTKIVRAILCSSRLAHLSTDIQRRQVVESACRLCLLVLTESRDSAGTDLLLQKWYVGEGSGWIPCAGIVPDGAQQLVSDGSMVYSLGDANRAWQLQCQNEFVEWRTLPPKLPQRETEAVVAEGRLIVLGGLNEQAVQNIAIAYTDEVQMFDPVRGEWVRLPSMICARGSGFACAASPNRVYVAGGLGDLGVLKSVECLDLRKGHWTNFPCLSEARLRCAGACLLDQFLVIGGQFNKICEALKIMSCAGTSSGNQLEPDCNHWVRTSSVPFQDAYVRVASMEGRLYAFGRSQGAMFDVVQNRWFPFPYVEHGRIISVCAAHSSAHADS